LVVPSVTINPPTTTLSVTAGQSITATITSTAGYGYSGGITYGYNLAIWPNTVAATFSTFTPTAAPWSTTITIYTTYSAASNSQPQTYSLPIYATAGTTQPAATISLTVNPPSSQQQQERAQEEEDNNGVTMYSEITPHVYPAANGNPPYQLIEVQAYTQMDYPIAAVYDVEVDSSLYQGYNLYPCSQPTSDVIADGGTNGAEADASFCGYPPDGYLPISNAATYTLESEHYLNVTAIYTVGAYDSFGDDIYEDPYGFSLADDEDDEDPVYVIYPVWIDLYITIPIIDLGGTASFASTQDQMPYIISISPNYATPTTSGETAVCVTITGGGFGAGGQINITGDSTLQWSSNNGSCTNQWSDGVIQTTFILYANATPGDRAVSVTSGGALGSFFFGPAGAATSNSMTFTVGGANCAIDIPYNQQEYPLNDTSPYQVTTLPLLATSSPA
jgi:hypothetical protein